MFKNYILISGCIHSEESVSKPHVNQNKRNLYIDVYKTGKTPVIQCRNEKKKVISFTDINKYNCYVNNIEIINELYATVVYKSFHNLIDYMDKLVAIYFDELKIMNFYIDIINQIIDDENYKVIIDEINENKQFKLPCYYLLKLSKLSRQIINISFYKEKLRYLIELDSSH